MMLSVAAAVPAAQAQGKTRDQVKRELVQAQHEGVIPIGNTRYPNTQQMIDNNKATHAATRHPGEPSPKLDHHDGVATQ
jgi:hypothetical protein